VSNACSLLCNQQQQQICAFPATNHLQRFNLQKLPNPPHHVRHNRTGLDAELQRELFNIPTVLGKVEQLQREIQQLLADYEKNADPMENVVEFQFGCLQGKHRSVAVVDYITKNTHWTLHTNKWKNIVVKNFHRDLTGEVSNRRKKVQTRRNDRAAKFGYS